MAIGDAAAAAGLVVYAATQDRRLGYQNDNQRGDDIAAHMTAVTAHTMSQISGTLPVSKGGTGATTAAAARSALGAAASTHTHSRTDITGIWGVAAGIDGSGTCAVGISGDGALFRATNVATTADVAAVSGSVSSAVAGKRDLSNGDFNAVTIYNTPARDNPVSSGYYALYVNEDGRIGRTPSARKYKTEIEPATIDTNNVLALQPVTYHLIADEGHPDSREVGLIADDCQDVPGLVIHGEDGAPESVAYERLSVHLLAVIKYQANQIRSLIERVTAIEEGGA